ncbi:ABC transporter ATP-binding protein [Ruminococcus gauvreauii]|uniref:ABC transporter ATP-binding protein n=1 Tax=Ruminococcus gauvreauii TaxID=438033 RepID=A0ABY5VEN1_9FIRM|nr:ABC transporter ATP-binding protein [Ruminococcus gauvreauii]UWP58463.1 ABC transporter ATP-binding protein [Ruminococcus gauvreauii]
MLKLEHVDAGYGKLSILWDVSLEVKEGEFVALVGPNGAGKTTTLRAISNIITPTKGKVIFDGHDITNSSVQEIMKTGLSYITDDGALFSGMTVYQNLRMGAYAIKDKAKIQENYERVLQMFPRLKERLKQNAGTLSGGERKMLAIARGLMSGPKAMLIDEPSLGLAPNIVLQVLETLKQLTESGVSILLVEQNVNTTLQVADRAYVLEDGRVVLSGKSDELLASDHIQKAYLGI